MCCEVDMRKKAWWKQPLRVIQYNLQVKDTRKMDPQEIVSEAKKQGADAVVLNVGGIYAWYESKIPFHHINEFLPPKRELLKELIDECHRNQMYVIGRFDFSKAEDVVFLQRPEWFVKNPDGKPVIYGGKRMGNWSLLVSTCVNGGYRSEEFAGAVLEEAITSLEIDGIFFNAPHMEDCWCENCRRKYRIMYGKELPREKREWEKEWKRQCLYDNMRFLYRKVKKAAPSLPVIMYYATYSEEGMDAPEDLKKKYETADFICTEAQDILSVGKHTFPYRWKPVLNMKLGRMPGSRVFPFGIIHSCPGMDWRHTGLPTAEYEYWMSQIPASGGQLWHSLTGYGKTITDHRILETVEKIDVKAEISNRYMNEALPVADGLILWNGKTKELTMAKALLECHILFEFLNVSMLSQVNLNNYPVIVIPDELDLKQEQLQKLREYVRQGGRLLLEKTDSAVQPVFAEMAGIELQPLCEENLQAAYGVFEKNFNKKMRLGEGRYLPVRGRYLRVQNNRETQTVMTLIPPFAPPDGVGAPPERASFPVEHTDLPLITHHVFGKGVVVAVWFELAELIVRIGLEDQKILLEDIFCMTGGERQQIFADRLPDGVHLSAWKSGERYLFQMVNGIGERPLKTGIPCENLKITLKLPENTPMKANSVLEHHRVAVKQKGEWLKLCIDRLEVWDLIVVQPEGASEDRKRRETSV